MRYALDTNTIIHILRQTPSVLDKFNAAVDRGDEIIIPPIVHYEMLRGFKCKPAPKKESAYIALIKRFPVGELTIDVLECGADIYSELYNARLTVEDADLLTAAFCITGRYTIVTNNVKHFNVINNLLFEDWTVSNS